METRIIVSGGGLVRVFSLPSGALQKCVPLAGAGALCCGGGQVFCACAGAVVRLDAGTLTPRALFAGGPGVCGLMHAARRLYALCGEGDGVLMVGAQFSTNATAHYQGSWELDENGNIIQK